ncbi:hypothetical protein EIO_3190 (plasmid) [Ketogulonicigenium vulgare Y25]|uniref:Uncharacterized protein n=1 Tax=Ketogulonicigenium vulgare (strain WSH-001) TaxID=759362 RepID=F9YBD0_KETVW|nr:hypothetical protein EIO_3190 [Ketogulonicigenium vulgare Y25]AEM42682.1 hypothetical protein KVU_PB0004 [Ketogulonicigenium vulgare WSH-001]ALJ82866.1 hypothetical protein KVH_16345 [Ketogulonicigenium vulgare]
MPASSIGLPRGVGIQRYCDKFPQWRFARRLFPIIQRYSLICPDLRPPTRFCQSPFLTPGPGSPSGLQKYEKNLVNLVMGDI